uniref:RecF/RecN/SMC N-terminal domain-containing protein n=1 Tax=Monodelphis domestica TaxID=13616 RepID=H9H951_MONDO
MRRGAGEGRRGVGRMRKALPPRGASAVTEPMAQIEEEPDLQAVEEQEAEGPRAESVSKSDKKSTLSQSEPQASAAAASQTVLGESGIIESIQLENFMSYAMLGPVKFGSRVTIVVGSPGKSALLIALAVGLSGKSTDDMPLKDFVKDGEASASISITLKNQGDSAFKSALYRDSIIVQRHINKDGSESCELKNQEGNLVSSEKEELTAILDHFKIQVDNPVTIIGENTGKQLLQSWLNSDRYKLFLKASELYQMRGEYSESLERKNRRHQEMEQGKGQLEKLRRQYLGIEEKFKRMVVLKEKLEDLKHEMAWALVIETERELDDMSGDVSVGDQHTGILNQKLEAAKTKCEAVDVKQKAIHEKVQKLNDEVTELEPKCIKAHEEVEKLDKAYIEAETSHNSFQNDLIRLNEMAGNLHGNIKDMKESLHLAALEKEKNIAVLKEKLMDSKTQEDSLIQSIIVLHRVREKDEEEYCRIRKEEVQIRQMLNEERCLLTQWQDSQTEPIKRFGPKVSALVEAIDNAYRERLFTHKPIGPLGACIHLLNPEYALAIECCLDDLLLNFFCDNHKDERTLRELMKRVYPPDSPQPGIIVSAFECELYDTSDRSVSHPEFPTVLEALEIENAVVTNALIDMRSIESVLLVKSDSSAVEMMDTQGLPKNCSRVLTECGDEVFEGCSSICEKSRPTYLGCAETHISYLEKEVENKVAQLSALEQHVHTLATDMKTNQETMDSHYQNLRETRVQITNAMREIKNLEREKGNYSALLALEKEAQEVKEKMKMVEENIKAQKEEMGILGRLKREAERKKGEFKLKCSQVSDVVKSLMREQNQVTLEMNTQQEAVLHCENLLKHHLNSLREQKKEVDVKERELKRETALAKYICPERIEIPRASKILDKEIDELKHVIQTENYAHGSREELKKQYEEVKKKYQNLSEKLKALKVLLKTSHEVMIQNYVVYNKRRRSLSLQCKLYFHTLLSQWSHCGKMRFDHENETLFIEGQPGEENEIAFSNLQGFPGNRCSFSNFLLILTLWSITESPFRCLDIFDAYMDKEQQEMAMDLIFKIAHSQQHLQLILLTSQYTSSLSSNPLVEILQIQDPKGDMESQSSQAVEPET